MCHLAPFLWCICYQPSWELGFWFKWVSDPTQTSMSRPPSLCSTSCNMEVKCPEEVVFSRSFQFLARFVMTVLGTIQKLRYWHEEEATWSSLNLWSRHVAQSSRDEDDHEVEDPRDFLPFVCSPGNFMMPWLLPQILIVTGNACFPCPKSRGEYCPAITLLSTTGSLH